MLFYDISQAADETDYYVHGPQLWTGYTQALGIRRGVVLLSAKSVGDDALGGSAGEGLGKFLYCGFTQAVKV